MSREFASPRGRGLPVFESLEPRLLLDADPDGAIYHSLLASTTGEISLLYVMPELHVEELQTDSSDITLDRAVLKGASYLEEVGRPILPVVPVQIVIPLGTRLSSIEVVAGDKLTLKGNYALELGGASVAPESDGAVEETIPSDACSSGDLYDIVGMQYRRGVPILTVRLNPVEYLPESGSLSSYSTLTLNVKLSPKSSGVPQNGYAIRYRPDDIRPLADEVDNPDALAAYEASAAAWDGPVLGFCDPGDSYDYLIITGQAFLDAQTDYTIVDFMEHKRTLGYSATIVTIESILAAYTGIDPAEQLRSFIIDAYNNWQADYILLGGDSNIIPYRSLYCEAAGRVEQIPSDFYYQCLDGDFNFDGDENWGEPDDGIDGGDVDLMAEVYIGRVPAENVEEMANWVYKAIAWENNPDDPARLSALMVGERMSFGGVSEYASAQMEEIHWGTDSAGYVTAGFADDPDFAIDTLYDSDGIWPASQLIDCVNSNVYGIYNHLGHGLTGHLMKLDNADVDALTNDSFFFIYSQACWAGNFPEDAIAEHFVTSTRHGAYAAILNSRFGWGRRQSTDAGTQRTARQLWDALFGEGINQLGPMNSDSHQDNIWCVDSGVVRWSIYTAVLFGDPSAKMIEYDLDIATDAELPMAKLGDKYGAVLESEYGTGSVTWTVVDGELPPGLVLDGERGIILGIAAELGTYDIAIRVDDDAGATETKWFTISVVVPAEITTHWDLPHANLDNAYDLRLEATGGTWPWEWTLVALGDYSLETTPESSYVGGGTAMKWRADDQSWKLALPWTFTFYGQSYDSVWVCSNGYIDFTSSSATYRGSVDQLIHSVRIAVLWDDIVTTGGDIYASASDDHVAIRWDGITYEGQFNVDFECVLYRDGTIAFNYGAPHEGLIDSTIGISAGDGVNYVISDLSGLAEIPAGVSLLFTHPKRLPGGLTLDRRTGDVSGTPNQTGRYGFVIQIRDSGDPEQIVHQSFILDVKQLPQIAVELPTEAAEGDGALAGTIRIAEALGNDLVIALTSSDEGELTVPASVVIRAGETSAAFEATITDDTELDWIGRATITASSPGYADGRTTVTVHDNETVVLSALLPASGDEGGSARGSIRVDRAPTSDVRVDLFSSDETAATVPPIVTIRAGTTECVFDIELPDDPLIDGTQTVTITAFVENWNGGTSTLDVLDNESLDLVVMLPVEAWEGQGTLAGAGAVAIGGIPLKDIVVTLTSSDTGEIVVPQTVTIRAGETFAAFDVTVINDHEFDGMQMARVSAKTAGFVDGFSSMSVGDNELSGFSVDLCVGDYVETDGGDAWLAVGTPMHWHADEIVWKLKLPWVFNYYGRRYDEVWVSSDGYLDFAPNIARGANTTAELISHPRIAGMWDDLRTSGPAEDIFIDTDDPNALSIRWKGSTYVSTHPVDFMITLYRDGRIRFDYGNDMRGITPTIGISAGDGIHYLLSALDGSTTIGAGTSIVFTGGTNAVTAGEPFPVTITALDIEGLPIKVYDGSVALRVANADGVLPVTPSVTTGAFVGGSWTGTVTVHALADDAVLSVGDSSGMTGSSASFDVRPGPAVSFRWELPGPVQSSQSPFAVSVVAVDAHGYIVSSYNGPVTPSGWSNAIDGSTILITEVSDYPTDFVEIRNVSGRTVDTSGWSVVLNDATNGDPNTVNAGLWTLPPSMAAGETLYRTDDPYDNYWGANIGWDALDELWAWLDELLPTSDDPIPNAAPDENLASGSPKNRGWAMILDDEGAIVDFVAWGYTLGEISGMHPVIDGRDVAVGDEWTETLTQIKNKSNLSLQRTGSSDRNIGADFRWASRTLGEANAGMLFPFPVEGEPVALDTAEVTLVGGRWSGSIRVLGEGRNIRLLAEDDRGRAGSSSALMIAGSTVGFDSTDLAIWQQNYDPLGLNKNTFEQGDFNGDGRIDSGDLAVWQQHYRSGESVGGSLSPAPEVTVDQPVVEHADAMSPSESVIESTATDMALGESVPNAKSAPPAKSDYIFSNAVDVPTGIIEAPCPLMVHASRLLSGRHENPARSGVLRVINEIARALQSDVTLL